MRARQLFRAVRAMGGRGDGNAHPFKSSAGKSMRREAKKLRREAEMFCGSWNKKGE